MTDPKIPKLISVKLPAMLREVEREIQKTNPDVKYISAIRFDNGNIIIEACCQGSELKTMYRLPK